MSTANLSLEELESRCEVLQRRVHATSGGAQQYHQPKATSPPRNRQVTTPSANTSSTVSAAMTPIPQTQSYSSVAAQRRAMSPSTTSTAYNSNNNVSAHVSPSRNPNSSVAGVHTALTQQQQNVIVTPMAPVLSQRDIANAISTLERERSALEQQMRMLDQHLNVYRALQRNPGALSSVVGGTQQQPGATFLTSSASQSPPSPSAAAVASRPLPSTTNHNNNTSANSSRVEALNNSYRAVSPNRSPAASQHHHPSGAMQTEQIYEELRQIRRAREEREAQRRAVGSPTRI